MSFRGLVVLSSTLLACAAPSTDHAPTTPRGPAAAHEDAESHAPAPVPDGALREDDGGPTERAMAPGWSLRDDGMLIHAASGAEFPPVVGALRRSDPRSADAQGRDGWVDYVQREPPLRVSVRVYPRVQGQPDPADEFRDALHASVAAAGADVHAAQEVDLGVGPRMLHGYLAGLSWMGVTGAEGSWLIVVPTDDWYYKARTTTGIERDGALVEAYDRALELLQGAVLGVEVGRQGAQRVREGA